VFKLGHPVVFLADEALEVVVLEIYVTRRMLAAGYLNIDPRNGRGGAMDPWSKVTASRASDGVTDRPVTSAERMKLHRRAPAPRPRITRNR
jgi:hypothetical protein